MQDYKKLDHFTNSDKHFPALKMLFVKKNQNVEKNLTFMQIWLTACLFSTAVHTSMIIMSLSRERPSNIFILLGLN